MGLEDEVRQARHEKVDAENLRQAWAASPFRGDRPVVETPTADLATLLQEALPLLRRKHQFRSVFVGAGPDSITRVTFETVQRKGGLWKADWPGSNHQALQLRVVEGTKDGPSNQDLIILDDGRIAWEVGGSHTERASIETVRAAVVKALA
jgi:hypothetical protein